MKEKLIARCGANCNICLAHLRETNKCLGCRNITPYASRTRSRCKIKLCQKTKKFCYTCKVFPCVRIERLDKRYRTKYNYSMIESLEFIKKSGIRMFIASQEKKYITPNGIFCIHNKKYYKAL